VADDSCDDLCTNELPDSIDEDYVNDDIVGICRSLVEVRREQPSSGSVGLYTLHLVHFSVRQYLLSAAMPTGLSPINRVSFSLVASQQAYLARLCLRYLLYPSVWASDHSSLFLTYASFAWYRHATPSSVIDEDLHNLINRLFDAKNERWDNWHNHCQKQFASRFGSEKSELALSGPRLHGAAVFGLLKTTDILCQHGTTDLDVAGGVYGTPLQAAAANGFSSVVQYLIKRGANINAPGGIFGSALNAAAARGHEDTARYLLENGADAAMVDSMQRTPLLLVVEGGFTRLAATIIEKGGSLLSRDKDGRTPQHLAAKRGDVAMLTLFQKMESDVNAVDDKGLTPLYFAARHSNSSAAKLLLEWGADLSISST
jgi:hypothetical protein